MPASENIRGKDLRERQVVAVVNTVAITALTVWLLTSSTLSKDLIFVILGLTWSGVFAVIAQPAFKV
jgi:hypothetical protein